MGKKLCRLEKRFENLIADRLACAYSLICLQKAVLDVLSSGDLDEESRKKLKEAVQVKKSDSKECLVKYVSSEEDPAVFHPYFKKRLPVTYLQG